MTGALGLIMLIRRLTDTKDEVEDAQPNVQPKEEDGVCHFTEQEHVAHVLLQSDWKKGGWGRRRRTMKEGEEK